MTNNVTAFGSMFNSVKAVFNALTVFGTAAESLANSVNNIAKVGEVKSGVMLRAAEIEGASELKKLQLSLDAELGIVATQ